MKNLKHLFFSAAFLLQIFATGNAQTIHPKLDSMFRRTLDSMYIVLNAKGLGAAVQVPNGAVWAGGAGISSANPTQEITPDHIFGIGSVNKTITSASILKLADEGVLSLGDSLHSWLDTFKFINPNITIRQLLRHQSGIYDILSNSAYQPAINAAPDSIWAWDDVISTFIKAPLFQPGAGFSYSNTNYLLLGLIIEKASGKPYFQEIRNQFLSPLGLESVVLPPYETLPQPTTAHLWLDLNGDGVPDDADFLFSDWNSWHSTAAPAGSYFSTPGDMARWIRSLMGGNLLSQNMLAEMKTTVTTTFPGGTKYGLGLMERNISTQKAYGHGGDAGYSASVWHFPALDISIAVLNNDGRRNSWSLIPTVSALLKTYIDCTSQITGNQEVAAEFLEIKTFPNPFSDWLNISTKLPAGKSAQFVLTNSLGEKVAETNAGANYLPTRPVDPVGRAGAQNFRFENLGYLPSGAYFLTTFLDGKMVGSPKILSKNQQ